MPSHSRDIDGNDNIYLNVVFNSNGSILTPAVYNITKTIPVADKPSDYYCSVIRFDIPLNAIPLFIMPIVANQSNANLTPMTIGISVGGTNFSQNVIYVSNELNQVAPVQNMPSQVITPYYYVFSFQNLIDSFNTALSLAFTAASAPGSVPGPYLSFNPVTQLISLVVTA